VSAWRALQFGFWVEIARERNANEGTQLPKSLRYLTLRSRATNRNESQYMSSVPDQASL
jgi:hypothetical protein